MTGQSDLLTAGFNLMLTGMGTVFSFLTLLVLATLAMSRLVALAQPLTLITPESVESPTEDELAAITAAIHQHRK